MPETDCRESSQPIHWLDHPKDHQRRENDTDHIVPASWRPLRIHNTRRIRVTIKSTFGAVQHSVVDIFGGLCGHFRYNCAANKALAVKEAPLSDRRSPQSNARLQHVSLDVRRLGCESLDAPANSILWHILAVADNDLDSGIFGHPQRIPKFAVHLFARAAAAVTVRYGPKGESIGRHHQCVARGL